MHATLPSSSRPRTKRGKFSARLALALFAVAPLAGCGNTDRLKVSSIATDDFTVRHPIVMAKDTTSIDVFPSLSRRGLDRHSAKQIATFGHEYTQAGQGPIVVLFPSGAGLGDQRQTIAGIKYALAAGGARPRLEVSTYPAGNPALASAVRLSYVGLKAKVADQCGQWPQDLGSASSIEGWENKQYYNFGCSYQSMIAAQAADPRDLVTPRGEEPADTQSRNRAIESIRKGADPGTSWSTHATTIGSVGGS